MGYRRGRENCGGASADRGILITVTLSIMTLSVAIFPGGHCHFKCLTRTIRADTCGPRGQNHVVVIEIDHSIVAVHSFTSCKELFYSPGLQFKIVPSPEALTGCSSGIFEAIYSTVKHLCGQTQKQEQVD